MLDIELCELVARLGQVGYRCAFKVLTESGDHACAHDSTRVPSVLHNVGVVTVWMRSSITAIRIFWSCNHRLRAAMLHVVLT